MRRTFWLVGAGMIGAVGGLLIGATIGGNRAVDFEFAGQRGYEAAGIAGAIIGFVIVGAWAFRASARRRARPRS
jgi:hypothetical protein